MFVCARDLEAVRSTFPYLVDRTLATGSGHVAKLNFHTYDINVPFTVAGVEVTAIDVEHGEPCHSVALRFGDVVYMSDVSVIPPSSLPLLACEKRLELLVLDCTFVTREISSHVNLTQALDIVRKLQPTKTLFTGLTHDFDWDFWSKTLQINYARASGIVSSGSGATPTDGSVTVNNHKGVPVEIKLPPFDIDLPYDGFSFAVKRAILSK